MSILINDISAEELLRVFEWARIGANNCMIGRGVIATELSDHGDLIDRDALCVRGGRNCGKTFLAELLKNAPVVIPAERSENEYQNR